MRTELEQVLALQRQWSSSNTEQMQARGILVRDDLPGQLRPRVSALVERLPNDLKDLAVEGRDATGLKSEVPWVRVFSPARSPRATVGWYLVFLFDAFGDRVFLSINQGTTRWQDGEFKPRPRSELTERADWARKILQPDTSARPDLAEALVLPTRNSKLARGYELGNVVSLSYEAGSIPSDLELNADFDFMCKLMTLLYEDVDNTLLVPGDPAPERIDGAMLADLAAGKKRKGGRFRLTAAERTAIEVRAVTATTDYLTSLGYKTKDVGATESYDLDARRGSERIFVEVKGTVSDGRQVILTRNEVLLHREKYPANMLAVVTQIELDTSQAMPSATGGVLQVISPWDVRDEDLEALSFSYSTSLPTAP